MISVIITHLCRAELMRVEKFSHIAFQIVTVEMYLVYRVQSIENFVFFWKTRYGNYGYRRIYG